MAKKTSIKITNNMVPLISELAKFAYDMNVLNDNQEKTRLLRRYMVRNKNRLIAQTRQDNWTNLLLNRDSDRRSTLDIRGKSFKEERPSVRKGHGPIYEHWNMSEKTYTLKLQGYGKGMTSTSIAINNTAEHMDTLLFGTLKKEYKIPGGSGGNVTFWHGPPLKWVGKYRNKENPRRKLHLGYNNFPHITHPGLRENPAIWHYLQHIAGAGIFDEDRRVSEEPPPRADIIREYPPASLTAAPQFYYKMPPSFEKSMEKIAKDKMKVWRRNLFKRTDQKFKNE